MKSTRLVKRLVRAFLLYTLDMITAIAVWVYGFGLPIKNVWILIALCLFLRFFWHMLSVVFIRNDAEAVTADKYRFYEVHP